MAKKQKTKLQRLEERWDNSNRWIKRLVELGTGLGAIGVMMGGIMGWFIGQFDGYLDSKLEGVSSQIEELRQESQAGDNNLEKSNVRIELMVLMTNDPYNTIAIEKMAKYYFITLNGDTYMSQLYSEWARTYGGDTSFVTHLN